MNTQPKMIRWSLAVALMPLALLCGAEKKPAAKQQESKVEAIVIPAGAKEVEPSTFHYTDPQGKKWIYRKTPFGLVKYEDKESAGKAKSDEMVTTAVEDGDSIRFQRPTPFGVTRWVRKKSELNEDERAAWEAARKKDSSEKNPSDKPAVRE